MYGIEVTNKLNTCFDKEEHKRIFTEFLAEYGFDNFTVTILNQSASLEEQNENFSIISTYPDKWIDYYKDNHFVLYDPVVEALSKPGLIMSWEETLRHSSYLNEGRRILDEASEFGLKYGGFGMATQSPDGTIIGAGMAGSEKGVIQLDDPSTHGIFSAIYHVTEKFFTQHRERFYGVNKFHNSLTARQHECLSLLADPFKYETEQDIAEALGITIDGVKKLCNKIYSSLKVKNRFQAVVKAKNLGIL